MSAELPDTLTGIGPGVFLDCASLTSIAIPRSLTSIGGSAFSGCGLTDVYYDGSRSEWNAIDIAPDGNESLIGATLHCRFKINPPADTVCGTISAGPPACRMTG